MKKIILEPDRAFPQYKFVKKNIVIVLPSVHARKGINTPRMDAYRQELLTLHFENQLLDI
jgi:hypothetical protein